MRAAVRREFEAIFVEDIDRLSRDQGDYHAARKRLDFLGITIHTATGVVSRIDGSLRALMGELFIENLAVHTKRGMEGVVRDGRHAGGRAYGYRAVQGQPGQLEIVESEAEIVRSIFADYVSGKTARAIAASLNACGIKPLRGRNWNASTINGNLARGAGIILNDIYRGQIVWNKVRMVKDPSTGRRISRPNPKELYRTVEAPHLRIVDDETWNAAQAIKQARSREIPSHVRKPPRLLSGLLRCGSCGGGMTSIGHDRKGARLQCSAHRESGTCTNSRMVYRDDIEREVLAGLKGRLVDRKFLPTFIAEYNAEWQRLARASAKNRARLEQRAGAIDCELDRIVDAIAQRGLDQKLDARMTELQTEAAQVADALKEAESKAQVITLHPAAVERYRVDVERLAELIDRNQNDECAELIETIRRLFVRVVVDAEPGSTGIRLEVVGRLAEIAKEVGHPFPRCSVSGGSLVAGEGLEPPTSGL
jgi:site-specific DNA recombinase